MNHSLPMPRALRRNETRTIVLSLLAALGLTTAASGASPKVVTEGTLSVATGGTLLSGNTATFQEIFRQKKDGYGGLEDFTLSRMTDDSLLRFDARILPGNADYKVVGRWEKFDAYYVNASFQRFRTFTDGTGGELLPLSLALPYFNPELALDSTLISLELGNLKRGAVLWRLRYDRNSREGTKNSIRWGDSNLGAPTYAPRAFIPSYLMVDEVRDLVTAEASEKTETANWQVTGRYQHTKVNDTHVVRRRAGEPQDRYVTMRDGTEGNQVSGHAFYERIFSEKFRASAGGMLTTIDTNLTGNRIYGKSPDAQYAPNFAGQSGDGGYLGLDGNTQLKQYLGNINLYYQPTERISILPSIKYENLRQDSIEDHTDVSFTTGAAASTERAIEANNRNAWNEVTEDVEARYQRWANWSLSVRGQWNQGVGNIVEHSILRTNASDFIVHNSDYERIGQRYIASATWYARPGLTLAGQYNYRLKLANYTGIADNTSNLTTSKDRYPQYIVDNDIASHDANVRLTWRPSTQLSVTSRYAFQRADVTTAFDGLGKINNGRLRRQVITQSVTWNPTARLYITGAVNATFDQLWLPPHRLTIISDNNYVSTSLAAGYALGKVTDVYIDLSSYHAGNYRYNPEVTLPLNSTQTLESGFITWVRRHSDRVTYTAKYGHASNLDVTNGGQKNFRANVFYAKVQLKL